MAWGKITSKTLTVAGLHMETDEFTPNTFMSVISHALRVGVANGRWQFGSGGTIDTGSNYCSRRQINGGTDIVATAQAYIWYRGDAPDFTVGFIINIAGEEKLVMGNAVNSPTAGAGNAPDRQEWTGKWVNTSNQIDIIESENGSGGNLDADSNLSVLGSELTPAVAVPIKVQDGAVFHETDTNKSYVLYDGSWSEL